jgi:DNA-directed RNA polymerase specialized sigma24 family protein
VVVLSQALVLFVFSSSWLSQVFVSLGIPPVPLVPVSSTQVVVGSVLGIGLVKGVREIKYKTLGGIMLGWLTTPLASGLMTFLALFFVQNVFQLKISSYRPVAIDGGERLPSHAIARSLEKLDLALPALLLGLLLIIVILIYLFFRQQKMRLKTENELLQQQNQYFQAQKNLSGLEVSAVQLENNLLSQKLEAKRREYITTALSISAQREFLQMVAARLNEMKDCADPELKDKQLNELIVTVNQKMSFSREMDNFYAQIELIHKDFRLKLNSLFPNLTEQEKKLAILLRLNLTSKEMSTLLGISPKSVEIARYRFRKRIGIGQRENLTDFLQNL